ncbi:hypothetical protein J1614_010139 [Plenodomus biglobosus]|nr:hypothetical protein J1614_010139 [Plenodomus biglobosus]
MHRCNKPAKKKNIQKTQTWSLGPILNVPIAKITHACYNQVCMLHSTPDQTREIDKGFLVQASQVDED